MRRRVRWFVLVTMAGLWNSCVSGCYTDGLGPAEHRQVQAGEVSERRVVELREKYRGKIVSGITGSAAAGYESAMRSLLEEWDPIGQLASDLESIAGPPTERRPDSLLYTFDNGLDGGAWLFRLVEDRIVSLKRQPME